MGQFAIPILIATTAASGLYSARQSSLAGKAAEKEAKIAARREGDAARQREIERRRALMRALAAQGAEAAASGVSPSEALFSADIQYANSDFNVDTANTRETQARLRAQGRNARVSGNAAAITTLLDTAGDVALLASGPKKK